MLYEELEAEEWRPVVGWEGMYEVSSWGMIRSRYTTRQSRAGDDLFCRIGSHGYVQVPLSRGDGGKPEWKLVHRLVLEAFDGPYPEGHETNHVDGCKFNNNRWNLEFVTESENKRHAAALNRLEKRGMRIWGRLQRRHIREIRRLFGTVGLEALARRFNVSVPAIQMIALPKKYLPEFGTANSGRRIFEPRDIVTRSRTYGLRRRSTRASGDTR